MFYFRLKSFNLIKWRNNDVIIIEKSYRKSSIKPPGGLFFWSTLENLPSTLDNLTPTLDIPP